MEKQHNIKKIFTPLPPAEIIRFTNDFINSFLIDNDKMLDVPMDAIRIIFKIASDLRNSNFSKGNKLQLDLFDENFLSENNTFARFTINLNEISLNKNTNRVKSALKYLVNHKADWYDSINEQGKKISSYGGIVTAPSYTKGATTFLVSAYWLKKLSYMPTYNNTVYKLAFNVSNNKHLMFYFWLLTIPDFGTNVNLDTLNKKFNLNYSETKDFCNSFLKKVRSNLNLYSNVSFNYSYKGNLISISKYVVLPENIKEEENRKTINAAQKTHYWRVRHKLSKEQKDRIGLVIKNEKSSLLLLDTSYKNFVVRVKKENKKTTDFIGDEFLREFQASIIETYQETKAGQLLKNGYPHIL